jgi:peptidoglycan/xylan/chitin deacetylase (PgdA/CDA1 family)
MRSNGVVLAYHGVAEVSPSDDPIRLFVRPSSLRWQIRSMQRRGYTFLTMNEFGDRIHNGLPLAGCCALTFDDGTADHATVLPGVLESLGVPATVYVCPGLLGEPYPWAGAGAGVRFMSRSQLEDLARNPLVEIGSHTLNHTELHEADADFAFREMDECKRLLEDMLDVPVPSFCYPRCHYSAACPPAARRAGYKTAVVCGPRGSWDPYELQRESMHTPDGRITFAFKSRGLYYGTRDLAPFRLARAVTRPVRHFREWAPRGGRTD